MRVLYVLLITICSSLQATAHTGTNPGRDSAAKDNVAHAVRLYREYLKLSEAQEHKLYALMDKKRALIEDIMQQQQIHLNRLWINDEPYRREIEAVLDNNQAYYFTEMPELFVVRE